MLFRLPLSVHYRHRGGGSGLGRTEKRHFRLSASWNIWPKGSIIIYRLRGFCLGPDKLYPAPPPPPPARPGS